jgi:RHS repeat-associated protein
MQPGFSYDAFGLMLIQRGVPQSYKFTGKERDAESGLDNFGARYNASSLGRFMTPDPTMKSVNRLNPQTWNRYAYVVNNPLNRIDPLGLWDISYQDELDKKGHLKHRVQMTAALTSSASSAALGFIFLPTGRFDCIKLPCSIPCASLSSRQTTGARGVQTNNAKKALQAATCRKSRR